MSLKHPMRLAQLRQWTRLALGKSGAHEHGILWVTGFYDKWNIWNIPEDSPHQNCPAWADHAPLAAWSSKHVPEPWWLTTVLVVPFMLHGCKYKAMIRVYTHTHTYIYIYIRTYIQRYTPISIKYTENCQTWVSHPMELLAPALGWVGKL